MKFIIVTIEWMSAHGLIPLPTMRKSKDGSKVILHEDYFNLVAKQDEEGNLLLDGAEVYAHNSVELEHLLNSKEWLYSEEEVPTESADFIQVAAVRNLMTVTKAGIQDFKMTGRETNKVADLLPAWEELWGEALPLRFKLRYDGKPWRVNQAHTAQEGWRPSELPALYGLVSDHDGTGEDPIPYEPWMLLDEGLYYTDGGRLYVCTTSSNVGYDAGIDSLAALVKPVEGAAS